MPELLPVQSILFQNLLRDFQIIAPPRVPVWWMSDIIQPVAIVNSQVVLDAVISETAMQFATAGVQIAPAAGAILADTGQLPAGTYLFRTILSYHDPLNVNRIVVAHRDAADAADIWGFESHSAINQGMNQTLEWVETLVVDERVRATVGTGTGALSRYSAIIWRRLLS